MQPCLKKKSSGTGSQGDKKSHGSQKPTTPPELKVDGSAKDPNENLPDNVQVKLDEGKDK